MNDLLARIIFGPTPEERHQITSTSERHDVVWLLALTWEFWTPDNLAPSGWTWIADNIDDNYILVRLQRGEVEVIRRREWVSIRSKQRKLVAKHQKED